MLLNIIYYTSSDDVGSTRILNIGFLDITVQQVKLKLVEYFQNKINFT
jgi:hypothetical protein